MTLVQSPQPPISLCELQSHLQPQIVLHPRKTNCYCWNGIMVETMRAGWAHCDFYVSVWSKMLRKVDVISCPQINNLSIISEPVSQLVVTPVSAKPTTQKMVVHLHKEVYECNEQQLSYKLIFNIGVVNIVEMGVSWKQGLWTFLELLFPLSVSMWMYEGVRRVWKWGDWRDVLIDFHKK